MRDYNEIQRNLEMARQRLIQATGQIERMRALMDIARYEYMLVTAD